MSDSRRSKRALVGSASTLAIGIVIGISVDRVVVVHGHDGPRAPGVVVIGPGEANAAFHELTEHLDLNEDQAAEAQEIFSAHQASVDTAWTAVQDHLGLAIASVLRELESVLDSGQLARLHEWMAERHGTVPPNTDGISH